MKDAYAKTYQPLVPCEPPYSFFQLVDTLWYNGKNSAPLSRLCTLMRKMKVKALIMEELELNEELLEEKCMASNRYRQMVDLTAKRLTFFRYRPPSGRWDDRNTLLDGHLLGYAVVVTITPPKGERTTYLLESVVRPPSVWVREENHRFSIEPITNYYVHNTRNFDTTVGTKDRSRTFSLRGSFFTQQNDITHVCAHAALRMAINSSSTLTHEKLTNKKINDILGLDFSIPEKCVGHIKGDSGTTREGLSQQELEKVIHDLGGKTISADFTHDVSTEYDQFIYPFIESSCPVILGVEGWNFHDKSKFGHAVSVLGHTLNSDRWEPEARPGYSRLQAQPYIPATGWIGHYIINDDNFGMYLTLPSDMLRNHPPKPPEENLNLHANMAIAIVPQNVQIPGWFAEQMAIRTIHIVVQRIQDLIQNVPDLPDIFVWIERLAQQPKGIISQTVSRTLLQTRESYTEHIKSLSDDEYIELTPEIIQGLSRLPEHIWVSEITLPHLYTGNKHKLGDVVIRADDTGTNAELIRLPGFIYFRSSEKPFFSKPTSHVPLIREEKTTPMLEW